MRLIDTKTHLLLEPWKAAGKEYAILSHTWGDQEVILQEWEQLYPSGAIKGQCPHVRHQGIDKKAGYFKVMQACEQARCDGFRYLWCDTMCINKESSAELSEAINSMFQWYRDAKVCYVYLADVAFPSKETRSSVSHFRSNVPGWFPWAMESKQDDDVREMKSLFMASRWWTRGWTLQELLAPRDVIFFTKDWVLLGHKTGIAPWISTLTRIHTEALADPATINKFSIAQRMSWAAERETTMVEDMAYCLLGIFDINMPMLYGQGEGAFQKLQHEIIKVSGDQSIFAWTIIEHDGKNAPTGALARSPHYFKNCGSIVCSPLFIHEPYSLTNIGFKMQVPTIRLALGSQSFIALGCHLELHGQNQKNSPGTHRRHIQVWIPISKRDVGELHERIHRPASRIYLQSSYPSPTKIVSKPELFLTETPSNINFGNVVDTQSRTGVCETGIVVALGFGNMSMISKAYIDIWPPGNLRIVSVGSRAPHGLSHQVISSGHYCVVLSVAWDDQCNPMMHTHTTLHHSTTYNMSGLLDQLKPGPWPTRDSRGINGIHQKIRSENYDAVTARGSADAPMIVVEDEPLYDMHQSAFIVVDIIFKEKRKPGNDH